VAAYQIWGDARFEVVVDLVRGNGKQRVVDIKGGIVGVFCSPDVVQAVAADAASQVCVQLSR
jgi:hypothetical protein